MPVRAPIPTSARPAPIRSTCASTRAVAHRGDHRRQEGHPARHQQLSGPDLRPGLHRGFGRRRCAAGARAPPARASPTAPSRAPGAGDALAKFYGRKHAMVFTTGYQANLGGISALVGRGDHLILDADSHASIYDAARLTQAEVIRFRHNDPKTSQAPAPHGRRARQGQPDRRRGHLLDDGRRGPAEGVRRGQEVRRLPAGRRGPLDGRARRQGRGLGEVGGREADVDFIVGTFSKSLGAIGGFLVSDEDNFDLLRIVSRPTCSPPRCRPRWSPRSARRSRW